MSIELGGGASLIERSGGGSGASIGHPIVGGTPNEILFIDPSGNLQQDSFLKYYRPTGIFSTVGINDSSFATGLMDFGDINGLWGTSTIFEIDEQNEKFTFSNGNVDIENQLNLGLGSVTPITVWTDTAAAQGQILWDSTGSNFYGTNGFLIDATNNGETVGQAVNLYGAVFTQNSTVDDGSGNAAIAGILYVGSLAASLPVFTNGSKQLTTGTLSGNTTELATVNPLGITANHILKWDGSLNVTDTGLSFGTLTNGNVGTYNSSGNLLNYNTPLPSNTLLILGTVGNSRATAQTAAVALSTYTVPGSDTTFHVSANVNVTTSTAFSFGVTCTYTDETNTSRVLTLSFSNLAGTFLQTITNVLGVGAYEGIPLHIRCKAATTIVIQSTGTFTTVVYNLEERIIQV